MQYPTFSRLPLWLFFFSAALFLQCGQKSPASDKTDKTNLAETSSATLTTVAGPDEVFGPLFEAVQMNQIFPDGKTFADATPKGDPKQILEQYNTQKSDPNFDLKQFVATHFTLPAPLNPVKSDSKRSPADQINALWPALTIPADPEALSGTVKGALLPLPNTYIVPGGRFSEMHYWDSYFIMLGLKAAGQEPLIQSMLQDFAFLIDRYGHIPAGNRSYYLGRSQPPVFSLMQTLMSPGKEGQGAAFLIQLEKEYAFWMDGANKVNAQNPAYKRVVWISDTLVVNRYWSDQSSPRPESYREDVETASKATGRPKEDVYRNLRAGAESGWDFSSRWMDGNDLGSIHTTDIVPIDLNCLMWHLEEMLADLHLRGGDAKKAQIYAKRALNRSRFIARRCFNADKGWFMDYNFVKNTQTDVASLAGIFPLFFKLAQQPQAKACATILRQSFLRPGGLVTTLNNTGQQWDAPNGWAPLQWISIAGLRNYEQNELADDIKKRWMDLNTNVYKRTGKMLAKYNVETPDQSAGNGQDGYGWTNGVLLQLLSEK